MIIIVYVPLRLYYEVHFLKDFFRPTRMGARLRTALIVCLLLALFLWTSQTVFAHRRPAFKPDYPMQDLIPLLTQKVLGPDDYKVLFLQTGLAKPTVDHLLDRGDPGQAQLLDVQRQFFLPRATVCTPIFGPFVMEDHLPSPQNGATAWAPQMVDLEDGDVLITYSTHSFGWRHGHAGLVVDAAQGKSIEAAVIGSDAAVLSTQHWRSYSSYLVLRLREITPQLQQELVSWSLAHLDGAPYRLTSGFWGLKEPDDGDFGLQCSYLVWYAFQQFGYDVDSDGGRLVSVDDLAHSPLFDVVQLYGLDPRDWMA